MGKQYYCDYCDRSFKDGAGARKKHISSLQHAKNRTDHYKLFRDAETILKEEAIKTPCKRQMAYGDCSYGYGCKFSHYTPPMIWQLQQIVIRKNYGGCLPGSAETRPNPNEIIQEFFQDPMIIANESKIDYPVWSMPPELQKYPNLPPSLWAITPQSVKDSNFGKWGL